ncbi:SDR family NAD(P)-dependent oxidoreductase [Enterovirga sp. CN4-39]|uniref:SDR family NAD(P)-dependent oxidoreductase n=1 Tax=Enterovirga sp. CN4-39 TaxID=3400910 RepID=UPI003C11AC21
MLLQGKIAAVTGSAGGLGMGIARVLAEHGAVVVAMDLTSDKVEAACGELRSGGAAHVEGVVVDVSSASSVADAFSALKERLGGLDILVNNAGIREIETAFDLAPDEWNRVIGVNLSGPFYCSQQAGLLMRARGGGSIINIASVAGVMGITHRPAYTAAKHGLIGLTRNLARDFAAAGIRVNAVAPGLIRTPMTQAYFDDPDFREGLSGSVPLQIVGTETDVANAALFLASDLARFVTGIVLPVDGGWLAEKNFGVSASSSFLRSEHSTSSS